MTRYRALLAYDGSAYQGFQRQPDEIPTIQLALEQAIERVATKPISVMFAGRTDTGVHASGQVIAFDIAWRHSDFDLLKAINAVLPNHIALLNIEPAEGFHPRFDARARWYQYTLWNAPVRHPLYAHYAWHIYGDLDTEAMAACASLLIGEHDFATFGHPPKGDNTVRNLFQSVWSIETVEHGHFFRYDVEGTAFLHHMVRRMVGMMVSVGLQHISCQDFEKAFRQADIRYTGHIAPPHALVMKAVRY
ncbi:tRNA pseudouridine(38-40) synthase TruA [Anaerolineales bacterium]|jgi:tRNA pseudouridine38-40 synthase